MLALIARPQGGQGRTVRVKTGHKIFDGTLTNILAGQIGILRDNKIDNYNYFLLYFGQKIIIHFDSSCAPL